MGMCVQDQGLIFSDGAPWTLGALCWVPGLTDLHVDPGGHPGFVSPWFLHHTGLSSACGIPAKSEVCLCYEPLNF